MKEPDKIYVEIRHPFSNEFTEMVGFENRGNSDDVEYIRKDALLEWAEECLTFSNALQNGLSPAYQAVIDKINSYDK